MDEINCNSELGVRSLDCKSLLVSILYAISVIGKKMKNFSILIGWKSIIVENYVLWQLKNKTFSDNVIVIFTC